MNKLKALTELFLDEIKLKNLNLFHKDDFNLLHEFYIENISVSNEPIAIDTKTSFLSYPNSFSKCDNLLNVFNKYNRPQDDFLNHDLIYFKDHNLITVEDGTNHRVYALYQYVQNKNITLEFKNSKFKYFKFNELLFKDIIIDIKSQKICIENDSISKKVYFLETSQMINIILYLQNYYIGYNRLS